MIGIGLNVNLDRHAFPADLLARATSIRIERGDNPVGSLGGRTRPDPTTRPLVSRPSARPGAHALNAAWRDRSEHLGRVVRVATPGGPRAGRLVNLDLHLGLTLDVERATAGGPARAGADRDAPRPLIRLAPAEVQAIETIPTVHDA